MFQKILDEGRAGDNVGALLRGVEKDDATWPVLWCQAPSSLTPSSLRSRRSARRRSSTPFFSGYAPQFYFRTTDVTGKLDLIGAEMCMPGDNVQMAIDLGDCSSQWKPV